MVTQTAEDVISGKGKGIGGEEAEAEIETSPGADNHGGSRKSGQFREMWYRAIKSSRERW